MKRRKDEHERHAIEIDNALQTIARLRTERNEARAEVARLKRVCCEHGLMCDIGQRHEA
jgi:hypothetical protein